MRTRIILGIIAIFLISIPSCTNNNTRLQDQNIQKASLLPVWKSETLPDVISSDEALVRITEGNARYVSGNNIFPDMSDNRKHEEVEGQHPFATVIGCSDSRVPVELLFDQGIGDLFVIRTAGNAIEDKLTMGSLDYSLEHLHVKLIVVLGHEKCGGITGAITSAEGGEKNGHSHSHDQNINEMLTILQKGVKGYIGKTDQLDHAIDANIKYQVELIRQSPLAKEMIENGSLKVVGARYELEHGNVIFLDI